MKKKLLTTISVILCITLFFTTNIFAGNSDQEIKFDGKTYVIEYSQNLLSKKIIVECEEDGEKTILKENVFSNDVTLETTTTDNEVQEITFDKSKISQYSENIENEGSSTYKKISSKSITYNGKKFSYSFYKNSTLSSSSSKKYKCIDYSKGSKKTRYYKTIPTLQNRFKSSVDSAKSYSVSCSGKMGTASMGAVAGILGSTLSLGLTVVIGAVVFVGGGISAAQDYYHMLQALDDCNYYWQQL